MPSSNRLPTNSGWEKLKGPATGNAGDDVGPAPPSYARANNFEPVSFESHQARLTRGTENTRANKADTGSASFAAQAEPRGFKDVAASGHAAKGTSPQRTKTTEKANINSPVPLT